MAAHADGLYSSNLDVTGLAQKYGAVLSHIKVSGSADQLTSTRIANGEADTLIGADVIVSAGDEVLATLVPGKAAELFQHTSLQQLTSPGSKLEHRRDHAD